MFKRLILVSTAVATMAWATASQAGPVFLTGHDPDFHAQDSTGASNLLRESLNFVTGGSYSGGVKRFLFVESDIPTPSGHRIGENGLNALGLAEGVNYDEVDAAGLAALANFKGYSAIVVASDFGGLLGDAEIRGLTARKADIAAFVNAGGGLAAYAECGVGFSNCNPDLVNATTPLFGFVPIGVSSVNTTSPYTVTPYGASLGLTDADVNDPTHNSFLPVSGLNVVDHDAAGIPTTYAGNVTIGGGGFGVPEPGTWAFMVLGFGAMGAALRSRRRLIA